MHACWTTQKVWTAEGNSSIHLLREKKRRERAAKREKWKWKWKWKKGGKAALQ